MTLIKVGSKIINVDLLSSALLDEPTQVLNLQLTSGEKLALPLDEPTQALYDWLVQQCEVSFDVTEQAEKTAHGLSKSAWTMLVRIERHEQRTGLLGLPIDDDDMDVTIELERKTLIRTDVHHAWLTEEGRSLLSGYRASKQEKADEAKS